MAGDEGSALISFDVLNFNLEKVYPQKYAIESGKSITAQWPIIDQSGAYSFTLQGPNGFVRNFVGNASSAGLSASMSYDIGSGSVVIAMTNTDQDNSAVFTVVDNAYNVGGPWTSTVGSQNNDVLALNMSPTGFWYDFTVTAEWQTSKPSSTFKNGLQRDVSPLPYMFMRRFAGRMETGVDTITDPAMGSGVPPVPVWPQTSFPRSNDEHPKLSERWTHLKPSKRPRLGEVEVAEPGKAHKDTLKHWTPASLHTEL